MVTFPVKVIFLVRGYIPVSSSSLPPSIFLHLPLLSPSLLSSSCKWFSCIGVHKYNNSPAYWNNTQQNMLKTYFNTCCDCVNSTSFSSITWPVQGQDVLFNVSHVDQSQSHNLIFNPEKQSLLSQRSVRGVRQAISLNGDKCTALLIGRTLAPSHPVLWPLR